jgi:hypothetical protein
MKKHLIRLQGCDDKTQLVMELSDEEVLCLGRVAAVVNAASTYQCMPKLHIEDAANLCPHGEPSGEWCNNCPNETAVVEAAAPTDDKQEI